MQKSDRYKNNLKYDDNYVYSYGTKVGVINDGKLICNKYYSVTTSKHLSYMALKLNLELLRSYGKDKKEIAYFDSLELLNNKKISKTYYDSLQKMIFSSDKEHLMVAILLIKTFKTSKNCN
jgi:hypothetical protein